MKRLFSIAAFVAVFAFLLTLTPVHAQTVYASTTVTMKPHPGNSTPSVPLAPLVRAVLVASDGSAITSLGSGGAVTLPTASATANPADALPIALGASDQSAIQRLFTAVVQGDGVNGNNMLPFAQYLWNGASWDRAHKFTFDADGNVTMKLASSSISLASSVASDSVGRTLVNIGSNTTLMVASISTGIVFQDVRSIATDTSTILADITSGTAAPFWLMIRNTGAQKIHVDSVAPGDTTDYIGVGEQYGPIFCGTNVMNEKFRANTAGTSTWALTIRK